MIKIIKESYNVRLTDRDDWFDLWFEDTKGLIATMYRNMASDLENGYDYFGNSIQNQIRTIEDYRKEFERQMDSFKTMSDSEVNRWCFYDMKKRGVIE